MSINTSRAGMTLIELIVSLMVLMVLITIGGVTAQRSLQVQARASVVDARRTALSDAIRTLSRHSANIDLMRGDLRAARDTVLELMHTVGTVPVCRMVADTLFINTGRDTTPWSASLPRLVSSDDEVRLWHDATATWESRTVRSLTAASGACGDTTQPWAGRATQRLLLSGSVSGIRAGAQVRIVQREKWSLVRGGDGNWSLSLAAWDRVRNRYDAPQPLLSPLSAPGARGGSGFAVRALNASGDMVPESALFSAHALLVTLRIAPHARYGATTDSVRINVGAR